jgi:hypothetical protein
MCREMKKFIREYVNKGWAVEYTNNGHLKWIFMKTGGFTYTASTPSDHRAFMNIRARLKRIESGLVLQCGNHRVTI